MNKVNKKYSVQLAIKTLVPELLEILGNQPVGWTKINRGLGAHLDAIRKEIEKTGKGVNKEATFYSVLLNRMVGKQESDAMFNFYNHLFASLNKLLSDSDKKQLHKMIVLVLNKFNKGYLDFIGELAVLYKYMVSGEFELLRIEEKIAPDSNVTADLLLKDKANGAEILIEIYNLHLEEIDFISNEKLKCHLDLKFTKKSSHKLINPNRNIVIQPVLWYRDHNQLKFLNSFFQDPGYKFDNVLDPLALASLRLENGGYEHRFETVKTIIMTNFLLILK